jgi:hypothetical protein
VTSQPTVNATNTTLQDFMTLLIASSVSWFRSRNSFGSRS